MKTYYNIARLLSLPVAWASAKRSGWFAFSITQISFLKLQGGQVKVHSSVKQCDCRSVKIRCSGLVEAEELEISHGVSMHTDKHTEAVDV